MSEFYNIDTIIRSESALVEALREMGYNPKVHNVAQNLYGYQGDKREQVAHIIIPRNQISHASNDIGFEKMSNGKYKMHICEYDINIKSFNEGRLKQLYAKYNILKVVNLKSKYRLKKQTEEKDGRIRIRLSRSNF